jgi:hypothetical protein
MPRRSLRLVLVAGFVLALATACGGGSGTTSSTTAKATTTNATAPVKLPFKATFSAPSHHPIVKKNWPITVNVTDLSGKPIAATLQMNFLLGTLRVGQVDNGKIHHFTGRYHENITFPAAAVGNQLTLQAVVKAKGKTKKLPWAISVVNR